MAEAQVDQPEQKKRRWKKAGAGGWNWLKSKQSSKALLATIASAVVGGLAVAGIVVPLRDVERRVGVVESRFDGVLDRLDAVDSALSSIQSVDPVGAVASLAPQVKDLAGQVGLIRDELAIQPAPTAPGMAATVIPANLTPTTDPAAATRLAAAEAKLAQLAGSLAAQQETSQTLSTGVAAVRSDLAAARTDIAAARAAAATAQATADAATARIAELESQVAKLEARKRTLQFGETGVAGPTNGAFATLSTVTAGPGRAFARWEWFHSPANGNCIAQVRIVDAGDTAVTATLIGDGHPNAGVYSLRATWDTGAGGTFRLQTAVSGNVICTSNRVFAEVEAIG